MQMCGRLLATALFGAVTAGLGIGASHAAPAAAVQGARSTIRIPGGELDASLGAMGDVYVNAPEPARAGPACSVAVEYVRRVQARQYDTIADLFADDAVMLEPIRKSASVGHAQIDSFYRTVIAPMRPDVVPVSYVGEGRNCLVSLAARFRIAGENRFVLSSVDHFTVDENGKVKSMVVYARPGSGQPRPTPGN